MAILSIPGTKIEKIVLTPNLKIYLRCRKNVQKSMFICTTGCLQALTLHPNPLRGGGLGNACRRHLNDLLKVSS